MTQDSIWYFEKNEFKTLLRRITDQKLTVSEALSTFREIGKLANKFKDIVVEEVSASADLMSQLFDALRKAMPPESKYKLPYNIEERKQELIYNLSKRYPIDTKRAECKIIRKQHNGEQRIFNYAIEAVIAPRADLGKHNAGEIKIIGNINDTPSIDGGERYFDNASYQWEDSKKGYCSTSSLRGILQQCGFSSGSYYIAKKRVPSVFYVNVKTPIPKWLGAAGKTHIDMRPYADDIAKVVSTLAKKMDSYHGKNPFPQHDTYTCRSTNTSLEEYLYNFLMNRKAAIEQVPSLKITDRLTQDGVWYRIRPKMVSDSYEPEKDWATSRKTLKSYINDMCKKRFGVKREDLGIIAASRATMLYKGQSFPVTVDNAAALARNGVAIIVIEKEGIADVLDAYAQKYGIALVHTQGRFVEYCKDLIEAVKNEPVGIIVTLTDYDKDGVSMAEETRTVTPRIGITRETVTWMQENGYPDLTETDVEEEYSPTNADYIQDEYLRTKRIELDSIVAKVGATGLWNYIMYQLQLPEFSPEGFDFNRVINMPANETFYSEPIGNLLSVISDIFEEAVEEEQDEIVEELGHLKELRELKDINDDVEKRSEEVINADEDIKTTTELCAKFLDELLQELGRDSVDG